MNAILKYLLLAVVIGLPEVLTAQTDQGNSSDRSSVMEVLLLQNDHINSSIKVFKEGKLTDEIPFKFAKNGNPIALQETLQKYILQGWRIETSMEAPGGNILILSRETNR